MWGRFGRRFLWGALAFFGVLTLVGFVMGAIFSGRGADGPPPFVMAFRVLGLVALLLFIGSRVRRMWSPVGRLIEAAGRLADGQYEVRVEPTGPRPYRAVINSFNEMAARLQTADEKRRRLLADLSHELRTPLSVIQGNLEAIVDGVHPLDPAHLDPILEETRVMARLLEDLRTLALAETGRLPLHPEPTDLGTLVEDALASFRPRAEANRVELVAELPPHLPSVEVDPVRIKEVIANLVVNALRYTPEGGRITITGRTDGERSISLRVTDTGAGISKERLPQIFDRFVKGDDSRGTGLGLTIARDLVEAHGGTISAQSEPGRGTVIQFSLPARR